VSTLSDYLNDHLPSGWQKPQLVEALSGTLDRATVYRYLAGSHPRSPAEGVLEAFAAVLPGATMVELRAAANLSAGVEEPWIPPVEANRLNYAQRRALEAFIKATVGPPPASEAEAEPQQPMTTVDARYNGRELTAQERAEVEDYINQLYASGRKDLADRVAASLAMNTGAEVVQRPAGA
jgi:hypothetical protein